MAPSQNETKRFACHIGRSVSLDHAAELLGVSRRTIYNRIRQGRLQTIRTLGSSKRVLMQSVIDVRRHDANQRKGSTDPRQQFAGEGPTVTTTGDTTKGEATMEVKTEIKAGWGDDSIIWGN